MWYFFADNLSTSKNIWAQRIAFMVAESAIWTLICPTLVSHQTFRISRSQNISRAQPRKNACRPKLPPQRSSMQVQMGWINPNLSPPFRSMASSREWDVRPHRIRLTRMELALALTMLRKALTLQKQAATARLIWAVKRCASLSWEREQAPIATTLTKRSRCTSHQSTLLASVDQDSSRVTVTVRRVQDITRPTRLTKSKVSHSATPQKPIVSLRVAPAQWKLAPSQAWLKEAAPRMSEIIIWPSRGWRWVRLSHSMKLRNSVTMRKAWSLAPLRWAPPLWLQNAIRKLPQPHALRSNKIWL